MDWCKAHRWGVTTKCLTTTCPPALALHAHKLTHIVHAFHIWFAVYKSFTCRGYEFLYSAQTLLQSEHKDATQAALYKSTVPSSADHVIISGEEYLCYTPWLLLSPGEL